MKGRAEEMREFAPNGFLKVTNGREFFVDMRNGEVYARMPEILRYGDFEIAAIGGFLCTRTKRLYEVAAHPALLWHGKYGLYLTLPYNGEPDESVRRRMAVRPVRYEVCLLNGDDSGVYWQLRVYKDGSLIVMDDDGGYFYVRRDADTGRAVKRRLGYVSSEADKVCMVEVIHQIELEIADRLSREAVWAKREAGPVRKWKVITNNLN